MVRTTEALVSQSMEVHHAASLAQARAVLDTCRDTREMWRRGWGDRATGAIDAAARHTWRLTRSPIAPASR